MPKSIFIFIVVIAPLTFIGLTAYVRRLVRGTGFEVQDFFLGVDIALASIVLVITDGLDPQSRLIRGATLPADPTTKWILTNAVGVASFLAFALLFIIMATHAGYEGRRRLSHEKEAVKANAQASDADKEKAKEWLRKVKYRDVFEVGIWCNLLAIADMILVEMVLRY